MDKPNQECGLCGREFENIRAKITHNCSEKPEDICEKLKCGRNQKEDSKYCPAHTQQVWIKDSAEPKTSTEEIPRWEVEVHYSYELRGTVTAPNKEEAKIVAEDKFEKRYEHEVHSRIKQVGSEKKIKNEGYKNDKNYLRLDTMETAKHSDFLEENDQ